MNMDTIKEIDVKSVMTKSSLPVGGYSVNPYVGCPHACRYCYASFMKRFTGHTEPWGTFLDVKNWKPITNPHKYDGERVVIGSVTDGYNPYEEEFHRTRRLLEELRGSDAEIMICTKSDLVLRDLDLLKSFPKVTVSWSVNTLDEQFCADMDNAVSIERRLKAMRQTYEAGIRTVCFVSPIFPRITDVKAIIEEVKDYADLIWLENLNLRGQFKGGIMTYIREKYPDLIPLYEEIYNKKRTYVRFLHLLPQIAFRHADQEPEQQAVEHHDRDRLAVLARKGEQHRNHQHQRDGHAVGPPRQVGQVAVEDDDRGEEVDEERRETRPRRQILENHRNHVERSGHGAYRQRKGEVVHIPKFISMPVCGPPRAAESCADASNEALLRRIRRPECIRAPLRARRSWAGRSRSSRPNPTRACWSAAWLW